MSQNFQREFKHCTIPATEWSTTTWATEAAQNCQWKPTKEEPRICLTARYIKNHNCGKRKPIESPVESPIESPVELTAPPPPPPPPPADAQAQEQLRILRAKIESHEAAEQDMQRQIAELEKNSSEMMEELVELRAKESKPNTKNSNSSLSDERSRRLSRLRAKSLHAAAAAALAEYSYTVFQQLKAFSKQLTK